MRKIVLVFLLLVFPLVTFAENKMVNQEAYSYVQKGMGERLNNNDHHKAIEYFSKAIELDPQYAEAYECRAMSYASSQIRNLDSALADYNKAIELDANNGEFYWGARARLLLQKRLYKYLGRYL